jgi:hypothetical protein
MEIRLPNAIQSTYSKWGTTAWSSTRVNLRTPIFIIYINDLPPTINTLAIPVIFADDTSFVITSENLNEIVRLANTVVSYMSKWSTANKLALNLGKEI